ncbi:6-phosphofructo-2-kinase [Pseudogymnoascus sp. 03VT05]|nr:6-phosphofructo-2-kinase [Pseudogymnoascus sp. 03VT05]
MVEKGLKKTNGLGVQVENTKICVVMVGLPARGKSLIAQKVTRYLKWLSIEAKVFNVGTYRRTDTPKPTADFFDTNNPAGEKMRRAAAEAALGDMLKWFRGGEGTIAILDATNSTRVRRRWIYDECTKEGIDTLFVESRCDDETLIMANILEVIINQIHDYLQSRIVYYLMNLHIKPRSIWLSRHGESMYNLSGQIGGDAELSSRGKQYALKLPELVRQSVGDGRPLTVWTSTLRRAISTGAHLPANYNQLQWKALDELDAGVCDGLTYADIKEKYPEDFAARDEDKYNYRYRGGESYRDVVIRLESIIMELERSEDILIITHQAVLRCIYAYYKEKSQSESPWMAVPLHTLIKLTPKAYGTHEERTAAGIDAVSTWRGKGSVAKHEDPVGEPTF